MPCSWLTPPLPITHPLGFQEPEPPERPPPQPPGTPEPRQLPESSLRTRVLLLQVSNWKGTPTALSLPWHFSQENTDSLLGNSFALQKKKKENLGNLVFRILKLFLTRVWLWVNSLWEGLRACACGDLLFTRGSIITATPTYLSPARWMQSQGQASYP